ncbi:hypothetical protein LTR36_005287 [Oleoguttula mirabilis]|uniref:PHD-type domain-containing protein n=1 Tax=Oleoguttula mirabilis TaxID=1507867 RepID=A0AAV9JF50_9PEZI|nr:hypothetical protein LTR36_005287 [Oleoguttula mirabilis]
MPRYKRSAQEAELDVPVEAHVAPEHVETLTTLRSMWEFASLMQYIFLFGHVVKIEEDFDIEVPTPPADLEGECLKPSPSERLARIGLALLKYVSSHRGLTPAIFDEYTRRQYVAKAPARNPFGEDEEPIKFVDMDIFTRIRVLQQLSTWTFGHVDRLRGMMPEDEDHLNWRIEPLGWDKDDRAYFVLDDNRLYRRSDEPLAPLTPPPTKPKAKSKSKSKRSSRSKATRSSKRRKVEETEEVEEEQEEADEDAEAGAHDDTVMTNGEQDGGEHLQHEEASGYGFTDKTWECIAITLEEYNDFLASIFRSRDPNEKLLRKRIEEDVLPVIEKRAEALRQKQLKKLRELENVQKMATAKRSSRLADKADRDKEERDKREAEEKKQADLRMAHEEEERQRRIEDGHESRRLTREQRIKEREVKRILHEEELQRLQEQEERAVSQDPNSDAAAAAAADEAKRVSARQTQVQKEQHKKQLEELAEEDGKWYFDCSVCGMNGENLDDGTHSVACDRCGVWQHSNCHGFSPKQAEKNGFTFICSSCKRKAADDKKPKIPPLKLGKKAASGSPEVGKSDSRPSSSATPTAARPSGLPPHVQRQLDGVYVPSGQPRPSPGPFGQITNGPSLSPNGQAQGPSGYRFPPVGNFAPPQQAWHGSPLPPPNRPPSSGYASSPPPPMANGYGGPPHHQQHQYVHQNAVATAGGHPAYQPPPQYQQQQSGYSQRAPGGQYPMSQPQHAQYPPANSYLQHQHQRPPPPGQQRRPSSGYQVPPHFNHQQPPVPPQQHPGSGQLMNGFQSPVKASVQPASSPPHQAYMQAPGAPQQPSPALQRSPKTSFPPPTNTYAHIQSPVKSSPPHHPQQTHQLPPQSSPALHTPATLRPPSANGYKAHMFQTPQGQTQPASAMANGVAADGMAGPWPEGSKAIPQKHDQSPAPPSSAISETRVMPPPVGALAPSPSQQPVGQPGNIPVKKTLGSESNGTPVSVQQPQQ